MPAEVANSESIMDLKEFVSQTLSQIISGVVEAQTAETSTGAGINPTCLADYDKLPQIGLLKTKDGNLVQLVEFDVALTVLESTGTKGGIGIFAGAINMGSSGQSAEQNSSVSRVRFRVPLKLPLSK